MRVHLALLLALAACGDDAGSTTPDAPAGGGSDAANGASATPEATGITHAAKTILCGTVNTGHYDAVEELVDQDIYKLTFSADTDIIIHFTGNPQGRDELAGQVAQTSARAGYGTYVKDHGALVAHVTAGDWYIVLGAFKTATDAQAGHGYRIQIETDTLGRGAQETQGGFPEAGDGTGKGNDMIEYDAEATPTKRLTTTTADMPEATGVAAAPGMSYRLTGTAENVDTTDDYMDRDTYEFTTGPTTNELSVRLNWPGTTRDFDFLVVPQGTVTPIATGLDNLNMEDEFETFSVKPNTTYWLWIGVYDGAPLPTTYDATLCGATWTP